MTPGPPALVLAGTWTLDPLLPVLEYWREQVRLDAAIRLAPYGQVFQQLLDPSSVLRGNRNGANVVCLRWEDLLPGDGVADGLLAARIDEVAAALAAFEHAVPCLVLCGPADGRLPGLDVATAGLASKLAGVGKVAVVDGGTAMSRYRVARVHDAVSDRLGHVPYTTEALAALGTTLARWYSGITRPPVKVFAVDGDQTLWDGVVGESGVDGLRVEPGHLELQRALKEQRCNGRLLCLLSKNETADARAVFDRRTDMLLRWDDFTAHRVDWKPKPDNLRNVAGDLGLGLDGVVFLDDNPVECARMRAESPTTLTVRVPADPVRLATFVDHLWLFDGGALTGEDRKRGELYRQDAARAASRSNAGSLRAFHDGLGLVIDITPPQRGDLPRLAQLSQRTNQFNASLLRLQEADLAEAGEGIFHRAVRVRDRFGDYGLVGQVRARAIGSHLDVDLFMLSCRALGRGVEHRMLAAAGAHAVAAGLRDIRVVFRAGERNTPVRRFLERLPGASVLEGGAAYGIRAEVAAALVFDPDITEAEAEAGPGQDAGDPRPLHTAAGADAMTDLGAVFERIACELTTAADIERDIAGRTRGRPELANGHIAPAPGMERDIAAIWSEVLRIEPIGAHDRFHDLGGKSVQLVQVHRLLLERLGAEVDIITLFQHPTVASLAAHLAPAGMRRPPANGARERGRTMRDAQARLATARRKHAHGLQTEADA